MEYPACSTENRNRPPVATPPQPGRPGAVNQNSSRSANCICRGVPIPMGVVLTGWVMTPNSPGPAEKSALGAPNCARLKMLNASARN